MILFFQSIKAKLMNLNIFEDHSINREKIRKQIWTTRLYLIALIIILFVLVLYTSLNKKSVTINDSLRDITQYDQLRLKYPNSLTCPCSQISISYKEFLHLSPSYHQVCSSSFVSSEWINYLYDYNRNNDRDFHATASAQFQVLASLCQLSRESINASLTQIYSTKLISNELISNELFENEIDLIVQIFQKSTPQTFKRTLDMIRGVIQGNFFLSTYQTNWKYTSFQRHYLSPYYTNPITYNNNSCTCGTLSNCSQLVTLNNSFIDGLFVGCYPVESMLRSSLQCLYNQTCLNLILSNIGQGFTNRNYTILSSINQTIINETVEEMVERLFVQSWYINRSYENYFQQCYATFCTYSFVQNFDIPYIITTILGLYGGLSMILGLIIPFITHTIFRIFRKRQALVVPLPTTMNYLIEQKSD